MSSEADAWTGVESGGGSICQVRDALRRGELSNWQRIDGGMRVRLRDLARRLKKVKSWGPPYNEIELSPELSALLAGADDCPKETSSSKLLVR